MSDPAVGRPAAERSSPNSAPDPAPDLTQLRTEVEDLQRRNAELEAARSTGHGWPGRLRAVAAVLLATVGALLVTVSVPTIWSRNLVLNTDRYVSTLHPLATDPGVRRAIVKAVDQRFEARVDLTAALAALPVRASSALQGPLKSAASSLVNTVVTKFLESSAFRKLWDTMNRVAHASLVAVLTGKHQARAALTAKDGIVYLDLGAVIKAVKVRLVDAGLAVAAKVPAVNATIELVHLKGLKKTQSAVRTLDRAATVLPILGVACLIGAVFTARRRRRAVIGCALSTAAGMVVLAVGIVIGRRVYIDNLPLNYFTADDAGHVFDTFVRFLRDGLRLMFVLALLVCALAWFTGSTRSAQGTRAHIQSLARAVARHGSGWRYAGTVAENRKPIAIGIAAVAALVLVMWSNPGVATVIVLTVLAAVLMLLVYNIGPKSTVPR